MNRVCKFPLWLTDVNIQVDIKFEKQSNGVLKKSTISIEHIAFSNYPSPVHVPLGSVKASKMHPLHPQPHVPEGHAVFTQGLIELILKCNLAGAKTCERVYHKAHLN